MLVTYPIAFLFEIIFPFLLAAWFVRRYGARWSLVWIGGLVFILSQAVHIPLLGGVNALFTNKTLPLPPRQYLLLFSAGIGGLLAALSEETLRALAYWFLKGRARLWKDGVALGIGHGGAESIFFVGVPVMLSFVVMMLARYAPSVLGSSMNAQMQNQMAAFFTTSWDQPLAGAVERLSTIVTQIALSVIVLQAFVRRNGWWYVLAVVWHMVIDAGSVMLSHSVGVWPTEGVLVLVALINLWIVIMLSRREPGEPTPVEVTPTDISTTQLEE
jgi:uncharacterized membrane protein YhfC